MGRNKSFILVKNSKEKIIEKNKNQGNSNIKMI